jgi:gamma-glutamyl hercynylcysteine S-oxide synthase
MDAEAWPVYSVAQGFRQGGPAVLRAALDAARERTLQLSLAYEAALGPALAVPQRAALNPPLWELGHVGWFEEYWVGRNPARGQGAALEPAGRLTSLLPDSDALYNSSEVPHAARWSLPLPDLPAARAYLAQVRAQTLALLEALPARASDDDLYFFRLAAMHEEMHAEAAIYMARGLGIEVPSQVLRRVPAASGAQGDIAVPAQSFLMGWQRDGFAFDNELQAHAVELAGFEIDAAPGSWRRYLEFVQAGGYRAAKWWDRQGVDWLAGSGGGAAREGQVTGRAGEPDAAAVHLTAHEARAWCRWAGRRLPTEAEWECAAITAAGFRWGEVWEWTSSPFQPYPGFRPHPYRDYSAPWFGSRVALRGACAATATTLAHPRYRNFFEPHRDDLFAGFRSCAGHGSGPGLNPPAPSP